MSTITILPPAGLKLEQIGDGATRATWTPSTDPNVGGYALNISKDGGATWGPGPWVQGRGTSAVELPGWNPAWLARIRSIGGGSPSSAVKLTEAPPPPPEGTWRGYSASNPMPVGVTPYAASSAFNTRVPATPQVLSNSAAMVANAISPEIQNLVQRHGYASIYYASPLDPLVELRISGSGHELSGRKIRCPALAVPPAGGGDAHMVVVQPDGSAFGFWETEPHIAQGYIQAGGCGWSDLNIGNGADSGGSAIGAGFGLMAGMIRAQELVAGTVPHALIATITQSRAGHIPPAVHDDGTSGLSADFAQEGQRLYLPISDAELAGLSLLPHELGVARAARDYGIYVSDKGGGFGIKLEDTTSYQVLGAPDPLDAYGKEHNLSIWSGHGYVFGLKRIPWSRLKAIV